MTQPTINDAKKLAYQLRSSAVLVLAVGGDQFALSSYGMTRKKCDAMGRVLDRINELIMNGTIEFPEELRA